MTLRPPALRSHSQPAHDADQARRAYGPAFRGLTGASLVCAYLLVVLGDTVRVTESGMGCSSWPLCNGTIGLAGSYHALLEQTHRYLAAAVSILVAATFVTAWRRARRDRLVFWSASSSLGLIGVQVVLGAVTVLTRNAGWTVALHLAGAWLVLGAVTVSALGVWLSRAPDQPRQASAAAPAGHAGTAAACALFALAVSGMLVLHGGASDACPGWPICGAGASGGRLVALQYLHRSLALAAAVLVIAAAARAWRSHAAGRAGPALAVAAVTLLGATVALGAVVAVTGAPPAGQGFHLALASALWAVSVAMATPAWPAGPPAAARETTSALNVKRVA